MPTRLVFDLIGWEVGASHLLIREVEFNPPIADDLFASSDIDFGNVVCEGACPHKLAIRERLMRHDSIFHG